MQLRLGVQPMSRTHHLVGAAGADYPGLLTDEQLLALDRIYRGVRKLAEAAMRLNTIKEDAGLRLPSIRTAAYEAGFLLHAVECAQFDHELAESKLRRAAGATPLREAA